MFKINNRSAGIRREICSKLTIKIPERRNWRRFGIFIVNFEHISHLALVFVLLTLSRYMPAGIRKCVKQIIKIAQIYVRKFSCQCSNSITRANLKIIISYLNVNSLIKM